MVQSFNWAGITTYMQLRWGSPRLAIPHLVAQDLRSVCFERLHTAGFRGVVLDKDNTLTAPYAHHTWPPLCEAVAQCRRVFGDSVLVYSNSAGSPDDQDSREACALEASLEIRVLRHHSKKPNGGDEAAAALGLDPTRLVMIGDRMLTDIVCGNSQGMLTILSDALTEEGDNRIAAWVRAHERNLLRNWLRSGYTAPPHPLFSSSLVLEDLLP